MKSSPSKNKFIEYSSGETSHRLRQRLKECAPPSDTTHSIAKRRRATLEERLFQISQLVAMELLVKLSVLRDPSAQMTLCPPQTWSWVSRARD